MDRKRRRYDSDDDDDVEVHHQESTSTTTGLVDGISVDNAMLRDLGMDDLISNSDNDDDDASNSLMDNNDNVVQELSSSDALLASRPAAVPGAVSSPSAPQQRNKSRVYSAAINVAAHVRPSPSGERGGRLSAEETLVEVVTCISNDLATVQHVMSAEQLMSLYRCDHDTRQRSLAVGAGGAAATINEGHAASAAPLWANRFGKTAGWRWDGVVRGTGAEEKYYPS
ncbi:pre-mRNA-splicing factor of RES complex, putative [Bodo saltans]|uniref:Pre-mRNA-splicing factor of RES complex, putative n=1 Tax=Bodo saltans TaxID=75058 RepID=A0A0S4JKX4_BODSA|nr:pre-mRNA-splicing factor of RES complex, putative [Bodo saltans]|eukprot:CUG89652.1 pre-mRNA-splicing factor of RES complex, putative [Bodo saltans]